MAIATGVGDPTQSISRPLRSTSRPPQSSSLNPQSSYSAVNTKSRSSSSIINPSGTKIHLANLDRVLLKPSPPPPPPLTAAVVGGGEELASAVEEEHERSGNDGLLLTASLKFPSLFALLRKPEADDIMSPRSLNKLHHLLSDSPRPSPKNSIASKWRLLHGAAGWSSLLDPLDVNLRHELVRYGDLVQAAYHAFHSLPSYTAAPNDSPSSRHRHLLLPDRSYTATKSLFATSSIDLPSWAGSAAPSWVTQRSNWIGYVAVCTSEREVRRMGRRDIVIVLRGTATCLEWAENLRPTLVAVDPDAVNPDEPDDRPRETLPKVAQGFRSLYKTAGEKAPSLSTGVVEEVRRLMDLYKGEDLSITVTGHSLGAALALLVADEISSGRSTPPIAVISFGGPRVGNREFADRVKTRGVNVLRVVNEHDVVTRVPGVGIPHLTEGFEHVGTELRVDNRDSPYLRPEADPACCHDLEAYLHLIDGFTGTGCPFRSDAKRSLLRLLDQQRPNVKRAYVRRAQSLGIVQGPIGEVRPIKYNLLVKSPSTSS